MRRGRRGAGVRGPAPRRVTNLPGGGWVAGQWGSVGADAGRVAPPPLRKIRRGDSFRGLTGGGAMKRISLPVSAPVSSRPTPAAGGTVTAFLLPLPHPVR